MRVRLYATAKELCFMTNTSRNTTQETTRKKADIWPELSIMTIFGGIIVGILTGWENVLLLAFLYAYSLATGLFFIKVNDGIGGRVSVTSASLWAVVSFRVRTALISLSFLLLSAFFPEYSFSCSRPR